MQLATTWRWFAGSRQSEASNRTGLLKDTRTFIQHIPVFLEYGSGDPVLRNTVLMIRVRYRSLNEVRVLLFGCRSKGNS